MSEIKLLRFILCLAILLSIAKIGAEDLASGSDIEAELSPDLTDPSSQNPSASNLSLAISAPAAQPVREKMINEKMIDDNASSESSSFLANDRLSEKGISLEEMEKTKEKRSTEEMEMRATLDRIEGEIAVVLVGDEEDIKLDIPVSIMPEGSKEGDVLEITIRRDENATAEAKSRSAAIIERLKKKSQKSV